jgi:3-hydroxyacyl-CoA dehydrogenase/3-hydroxy-2-methylbutyryl-CoA dehydrogenase
MEKDGKTRVLNMKIFKKTMDINVYGSVYVAKYAAIAMAKNTPNDKGEKGVILFVSSIAAEEASMGQTAYGASKGAINGILIPMARDLGKYNIRVAAIAPGTFKTPMSDAFSPRVKKLVDMHIPVGRMGYPSEFAHMAQTIVENSYVNGVRLRIDGAMKLPHM